MRASHNRSRTGRRGTYASAFSPGFNACKLRGGGWDVHRSVAHRPPLVVGRIKEGAERACCAAGRLEVTEHEGISLLLSYTYIIRQFAFQVRLN